MGEALIDLIQVLRSKKEQLTAQEANFLRSCKYNAERDFTFGALAGGTAVWAATWKLRKAFRVYLSAGAGAFFGLWIFGRSMYSCAEQILKLDGTILQKELANVMLSRYQNDPLVMQLISKRFYSENVFDDSTSINPKLRWRYRNFYSDDVVQDHRTHHSDSYDKTQGDSHSNSQGEFENVTDSKRTNLETKHVFTKAGPDIMGELDPLDSLFEYGGPVQEIHHPDTPNKPSGIHNRGHRRSRRRHRVRNHDDLSNSKLAAAV